MDFSWLTKFIPSLKDLSNYFLPLALTCTVVLFAPEKFIEQLGLVALRKDGQPYLGAAFLFSWFVIICKIILGIYLWTRRKFNEYHSFRETVARLNDFSAEEKKIIGTYIKERSRTLELDATNHAVIGLLHAGVLQLAVGNADVERAPCIISNRVWKYINLHQNLLHHDDEAVAYRGQVERRIMAAWKLPPKSDGLKVTLRYTLAANGAVSSVLVEKSSGNKSFDESAVQVVRRASPFPVPPKSFPTGDLRMVLDPTLPVTSGGAL